MRSTRPHTNATCPFPVPEVDDVDVDITAPTATPPPPARGAAGRARARRPRPPASTPWNAPAAPPRPAAGVVGRVRFRQEPLQHVGDLLQVGSAARRGDVQLGHPPGGERCGAYAHLPLLSFDRPDR